MQRGDLVGLLDGQRPRIGVVRSIEGKRCTVAVGHGSKQVKLSMRELTLLWLGSQSQDPTPASLPSPQWLAAAVPPRRDCGAAWMLLIGSTPQLPLADWAALLWPNPGADELAAAWLWLHGEQLWFAIRQGLVSARPLSELRQLRQRRRVQRLQQAARDAWQRQLALRQPLRPEQLSPVQKQDLAALQSWASGDTQQPLRQELEEALRQADCALQPAAIRHLLVDLGQWDAHALPSMRHSPWEQGFTPAQNELAEQLLATLEQPRPSDERRIDRTALACVTIDDDDTDDIDDALGLELTADGQQRVWIHIADPGRLIAAGDPLDCQAQRRGTSLYLARGIEPMFPWRLSTQGFSLVAGRRCAAWSIWVELDSLGAVAHYGIERTWIRPTYRLSYGDADELIELAPPQEAALVALHALMDRRRRWRQQHGALLLDQPEGRVQVVDGALLLAICEPTAARLLVAEAMILAGAVVAMHGASLNLALPYRSQAPSATVPEAQLQQLPAGPVRHAAIKQGLSRGVSGTSPAAHFSLGLGAYVQATSPIRRYGDLLVQRQLACLWEGREPLDAAALQECMALADDPVRQGIQISRDDQRHWRQVWFAEHRSQQWRALFLRWLRESEQLGLIWIDSLAMELPAHCPGGCEPAEDLLVKVHRVDPLQDCLQLRAHR